MRDPLTPKVNSAMVLSAAAATGHLRAADALVAAFGAAAFEIVSIVLKPKV